jgi:hypothetical protein
MGQRIYRRAGLLQIVLLVIEPGIRLSHVPSLEGDLYGLLHT